MELLILFLPFENGPPEGRRTKAVQSLCNLSIMGHKARRQLRWWSIRAVAVMNQLVLFGEVLAQASLSDGWFVVSTIGLNFAGFSNIGDTNQGDQNDPRDYCSNLNSVNAKRSTIAWVNTFTYSFVDRVAERPFFDNSQLTPIARERGVRTRKRSLTLSFGVNLHRERLASRLCNVHENWFMMDDELHCSIWVSSFASNDVVLYYSACLFFVCFSKRNSNTRWCIQVKPHAYTFSGLLADNIPWHVWYPTVLDVLLRYEAALDQADLVNRTVDSLPVEAAPYVKVRKYRHMNTLAAFLDLGLLWTARLSGANVASGSVPGLTCFGTATSGDVARLNLIRLWAPACGANLVIATLSRFNFICLWAPVCGTHHVFAQVSDLTRSRSVARFPITQLWAPVRGAHHVHAALSALVSNLTCSRSVACFNFTRLWAPVRGAHHVFAALSTQISGLTCSRSVACFNSIRLWAPVRGAHHVSAALSAQVSDFARSVARFNFIRLWVPVRGAHRVFAALSTQVSDLTCSRSVACFNFIRLWASVRGAHRVFAALSAQVSDLARSVARFNLIRLWAPVRGVHHVCAAPSAQVSDLIWSVGCFNFIRLWAPVRGAHHVFATLSTQASDLICLYLL